MFEELDRSITYFNNSNEKLEITVEMLLKKTFARESQFYKGVMKM